MRVKFVSKIAPETNASLWQPLLDAAEVPEGVSVTFDPDAGDYDALIVYEDLPPRPGERKVFRTETLACARSNTLLITTEPGSIRIDGPRYLRQFGVVWTSRPPSLTPGVERIPGTPPLRFFFGRNLAGGPHQPLTDPVPPKTDDLSAMCSTKAMAHTVHAQRLAFVMALKERLGDDLALFGRGIQPVDDKAEAMADYRYHIAIENHIQSGHFTEKLTDCFLAGCLPFYFGDPDYERVFPKDSVIPIDIFDLDGTIARIRNAIAGDAYSRRRDAIDAARRLTLKDFNTVAAALRVIHQRYDAESPRGGEIHGRHAFRRAHPVRAIRDGLFSARMRRNPAADPLQGYSPL